MSTKTKTQLLKEVRALKRKLEEKEMEVSDKDEENNVLNGRLNKSIQENASLLNSVEEFKEAIKCPICLEVPRNGPVSACPEGHLVCKECKPKIDICPVCRVPMAGGKSLLAIFITERVTHGCLNEDCKESFLLEALVAHEKVCAYRVVSCPHSLCSKKVPLAKLTHHLLTSKKVCCAQTNAAILTKKGLNCRTYFIRKVTRRKMIWPLDIFTYFDEVNYAVYPYKCEEQFFIVVVMFAQVEECRKFRFELTVHGKDVGAEDVGVESVVFRGSPVSIDEEKQKWLQFGFNEKFMDKILVNSKRAIVVTGTPFCVSFKIWKTLV